MFRSPLMILPWLASLMFLLVPWRENMAAKASGGKWDLLQANIGISAMHMQLLNNDRVVMFDRTDFGKSQILLPNGECRHNTSEIMSDDCTAHSVEYDVASNSIRALTVQTDVWCSSGSVSPNGSLIQTGGDKLGEQVVRIFESCVDFDCDWREIKDGLIVRRWYATNHILPDGRQIIIGGQNQWNFEFYPKSPGEHKVYNLPFLRQTCDRYADNNLYPFAILNVDGNLFIFANNQSILFDYKTKRVVRSYPDIPGGDPRNYPSTGSAVLLPLKNLQAQTVECEVLICGGARRGSFERAKYKSDFIVALDTCARISINDPHPQWTIDTMPLARVMGDMVMLPNGHVLLINGASKGVAGWDIGRVPVLCPVIYKPESPLGLRFEVQNPSTIPRMYHSTSGLLRDGRVIVGGSNPHQYYNFTNVLYPTELSLEAFSPPYLEPEFDYLRPKIVRPVSHTQISYGQRIKFRFTVPSRVNSNLVKVTMLSPPFNTHSFSMNQRLMVLDSENVSHVGRTSYEIKVTTPGSANIAPPGYYLLFVVHQNIPSEGSWTKIK